jgi:hypothetical protein
LMIKDQIFIDFLLLIFFYILGLFSVVLSSDLFITFDTIFFF